MKIVYVGDNRCRGNFGCRATSTALSQIIEKNNEIVGVVSGRYTNYDTGELFYYKYLPAWVYKWLGRKGSWIYLRSGFYLFFRMLCKGHHYIFSNFDYLKYDLDLCIENLLTCLPANPHLREYDLRQYEFDALVVNGEGSFIFSTPAWRESVSEAMLMHWALKMGKKVYYMNGMLSDDPYTKRNEEIISVFRPLFEKVEMVGVREYISESYAKEIFPNAKIKLYPDALFTWFDYINDSYKVENGRYIMGMSGADNKSFNNYDFENPYICMSGSSSIALASKNMNVAIERYCEFVNKMKLVFNYTIYLVEVCEGDSFLREVAKLTNVGLISIDTPILSAAKILANAKAYISGRYHPAILASMGGTPCVFMSSNSHKTRSLQELLGYEKIHEYNVLPSELEISEMLSQARNYIDEGQVLRDKIKERCMELRDKAMQMELNLRMV